MAHVTIWCPNTAPGRSTAAFGACKPPRHACGVVQRRVCVHASSHDEQDAADGDGDAKVQDALVNMIKFEIGKKHVEEYVEESGEKLRQLAEEAKEEIEKMGDLGRLRGEVAFDAALADINREADEFEERLRRSREEMEATEAEFGAWESGVAASRSEGHFFKSLYQPESSSKGDESGGGGGGGGIGGTRRGRRSEIDMEVVKARAERIKEPAVKEVGSPIRQYLWLALALLLAADVGGDIAMGEPSIGPDALYIALAGLAAWLALNERRRLDDNDGGGL